jgi:hypothetical protein
LEICNPLRLPGWAGERVIVFNVDDVKVGLGGKPVPYLPNTFLEKSRHLAVIHSFRSLTPVRAVSSGRQEPQLSAVERKQPDHDNLQVDVAAEPSSLSPLDSLPLSVTSYLPLEPFLPFEFIASSWITVVRGEHVARQRREPTGLEHLHHRGA